MRALILLLFLGWAGLSLTGITVVILNGGIPMREFQALVILQLFFGILWSIIGGINHDKYGMMGLKRNKDETNTNN